MAMSLNKVQIIGNLTRPPELRQTPQGQYVASFVVATNLSWTDGSGNKQDKAEFHNVVAWRKLAEICSQYLKKGSKVYIEGRLQTRDWEGEDGVKRYKTEIIADNMIMLSSANQGSGGMAQEQNPVGLRQEPAIAKAPAAQAASSSSEEEITIDDLPF